MPCTSNGFSNQYICLSCLMNLSSSPLLSFPCPLFFDLLFLSFILSIYLTPFLSSLSPFLVFSLFSIPFSFTYSSLSPTLSFSSSPLLHSPLHLPHLPLVLSSIGHSCFSTHSYNRIVQSTRHTVRNGFTKKIKSNRTCKYS